jgi:hypothetical protein
MRNISEKKNRKRDEGSDARRDVARSLRAHRVSPRKERGQNFFRTKIFLR